MVIIHVYPNSIPFILRCVLEMKFLLLSLHICKRSNFGDVQWQYYTGFVFILSTIYTQNQWKRNTCVFDIFPIRAYQSRWLFVLIECRYALFKGICSKTSYRTPCNVPHDWFVFFHRAVLDDWVGNILLTSKCRYILLISKYSKIKTLKIVNNFRTGGSGVLEGRFASFVWMYTPFRLYLAMV